MAGKRITILALGSRGDVQPFVALGLGLIRAGHTVRIAAAQDYESLVREHDLPFAPLMGRIAGVPAVPVPVFGDQRFWARRVFELGAAVELIPRAVLTADRLADAIGRATSNHSLRTRACSLAATLASEDGGAHAVGVIEAALR